MGAWGIEALESDEGLDVVGWLQDYPGRFNLDLGELIAAMKESGFFGESFADIDFYFDNSAMAVTELYLAYVDTKTLPYTHEEKEKDLSRIQSFSADREALVFLLRYLTDIRQEVPDGDGMRGIVELWRDGKSWDKWSGHLDNLINRINQEMARLDQ